MRLTRIFVPKALQPDAEVELPADAAHHVSRVLRISVGAPLVLFNGEGDEYAALITHTAHAKVIARVGERLSGLAPSPLHVTLVQGISRGERMDWALQKATELGVRRIVPVLTTRSVVKLDDKQNAKKSEHWSSVVRNACEQCGRSDMPEIASATTLNAYLRDSRSDAIRLVLDPAATITLTSLSRTTQVELLIGPEGGLDDEEIATAKAIGFVAVNLGPRVLRTETAAVAAIAVLQALWGDLST